MIFFDFKFRNWQKQHSVIGTFYIGLLLYLLSKASLAQIPLAFEELPDWSGVWQMVGPTVFDRASVQPPDGRAGGAGVREYPPYNEEWEAKYVANIDQVRRGRFPDPLSICGTSPGYPRMLNVPGAIEFILRPEQVWILTEDGPGIARVYTDGRSHPPKDEIWPTYGGESIGHWEADTLVFETIGLKGIGDVIIDRTGLVLSEDVRIRTEIRRLDKSTLEAQIEIIDRVAMTAPWTVLKRYDRLDDGARMFDVACVENNRNPVDQAGRTLTLDSDGNILDIGVERN
jgi:hypothetical protein